MDWYLELPIEFRILGIALMIYLVSKLQVAALRLLSPRLEERRNRKRMDKIIKEWKKGL